VVAVWVDGALYFSTGDHEQKAANMIANPHVIHVFSVTPTQIAAHHKGDPFSHTTHRFR
jgi:hypothetical protein